MKIDINQLGLKIHKDFFINKIQILVNLKRVLIKLERDFDILESFVIFGHYLTRDYCGSNVYLIKMDNELKVIKRKVRGERNTSNLDYEKFIKILNESNDTDFYDSGTSFRGFLIGLEIRYQNKIELETSSEILTIFKKIEKEKKKKKNE